MSQQRDYLPLEMSVIFGLFRAARAADDLHKWYLETYSLTRTQLWALLAIAHGVTRPKELAERMGVDPAGITRLVDQLAKKGYVRRGRKIGDRRALHLELTGKAETALPQLQSAAHRAEELLVSGLQPDHLSMVIAATRRIVANASETDLRDAFALDPEDARPPDPA